MALDQAWIIKPILLVIFLISVVKYPKKAT